jgi:hypothetical protein
MEAFRDTSYFLVFFFFFNNKLHPFDCLRDRTAEHSQFKISALDTVVLWQLPFHFRTILKRNEVLGEVENGYEAAGKEDGGHWIESVALYIAYPVSLVA